VEVRVYNTKLLFWEHDLILFQWLANSLPCAGTLFATRRPVSIRPI